MKRLFIFLLFISAIAQAQPITATFGSPNSGTGIKGSLYIDSMVYMPPVVFRTPSRAGALRYNPDSTLSLWTGFQWIVVSSPSTSIAHWNQAYDKYVNSAAVTGTSTKTMTFTRRDGTTFTATWTESGTVTETDPIFSTSQAVSITATDKAHWTQAYNKYVNSAAVTGTGTKTITFTRDDGTTFVASFTDQGITTEVDPIYSGSAAAGITNTMRSNWTEAYDKYVSSAAVTGTSSKTITFTRRDGTTFTATFTDLGATETDPVFGASAAAGITSTNITNWTQAYDKYVSSAAVTGTTSKTMTFTRRDGTTFTATWSDIGGAYPTAIDFTGTDTKTATITLSDASTVANTFTDISLQSQNLTLPGNRTVSSPFGSPHTLGFNGGEVDIFTNGDFAGNGDNTQSIFSSTFLMLKALNTNGTAQFGTTNGVGTSPSVLMHAQDASAAMKTSDFNVYKDSIVLVSRSMDTRIRWTGTSIDTTTYKPFGVDPATGKLKYFANWSWGAGSGGTSYTFTAADFDVSGTTVSLDYVNGQKATASVNGFLSSTDWSTFNGKAPASGSANYVWNQFTAAQTGYLWLSSYIKTDAAFFVGNTQISNGGGYTYYIDNGNGSGGDKFWVNQGSYLAAQFDFNQDVTFPKVGLTLDGTKVLAVDAAGKLVRTTVDPATLGGGGETNTASNLGGGLANFDSKSGVDLRFNSFTAADFNLASNLISIDYTNGQAASASAKGFLTSTDWSTFNAKQAALTFTASDFDGTTTIALDYTNGQKATASVPGFLSSADWSTFNGKANASAVLSNSTTSTQAGYFGSINIMDLTVPSNYLQIVDNENLTASHVLNLVMGNADRTLTMSGNATISGTNTGDQAIALTGPVTGTWSAGSIATSITANSITTAMQSQAAANTLRGNNTGATANLADLTATQVTAMLNTFTTTLKGLVPAPGTSNTTDFLRRDGSWAAPASGTGVADPGGNGIMSRTALNTSINRTLTGTTNRITITNGDGVSGNPTFNVGTDIVDISTTQSLNNKYISFGANSTTASPMSFTAGTLMSSPTAGNTEYDGTAEYFTNPTILRSITPSRSFVSIASGTVALSGTVTTAQAVFASANDVIPLAATTTYRFRALYFLSSGTTSHTLQTGFAYSGTMTSLLYSCFAAGGTANTSLTSGITAINTLSLTSVTAATTQAGGVFQLEGTFRTSTAGNLTPQIAFGTAGPAGTNTMNAGTWFEIWPVGTSSVTAVGAWQ